MAANPASQCLGSCIRASRGLISWIPRPSIPVAQLHILDPASRILQPPPPASTPSSPGAPWLPNPLPRCWVMVGGNGGVGGGSWSDNFRGGGPSPGASPHLSYFLFIGGGLLEGEVLGVNPRDLWPQLWPLTAGEEEEEEKRLRKVVSQPKCLRDARPVPNWDGRGGDGGGSASPPDHPRPSSGCPSPLRGSHHSRANQCLHPTPPTPPVPPGCPPPPCSQFAH